MKREEIAVRDRLGMVRRGDGGRGEGWWGGVRGGRGEGWWGGGMVEEGGTKRGRDGGRGEGW